MVDSSGRGEANRGGRFSSEVFSGELNGEIQRKYIKIQRNTEGRASGRGEIALLLFLFYREIDREIQRDREKYRKMQRNTENCRELQRKYVKLEKNTEGRPNSEVMPTDKLHITQQ